MTICTYYEEIGNADDFKLLQVWERTWKHLGFSVIQLNRNDAKKHPKFEEFFESVQNLPTVNQRNYEDACYVRWCAAVAFIREWKKGEKVVLMDYDVFPTSNWEKFPVQTFFTMFRGCQSVMGRERDFESIVELLLNYGKCGPQVGEVHVSDMTIIQSSQGRALFDTHLDWMRDYGTLDWKRKPMVHFGNSYIPSGAVRSEFISSLLRNGLIDCEV